MTQTLAIFVDAYRSLNAKRLFWIVLALSLLVVASFFLVGINEKGVKVVGLQFEDPVINATFLPPALFFKFLFLTVAFPLWLAWVATILALVSTAGIFPDLITSGAIDLVVSKPIGRLRLFITQYVVGLLFVTLQVTVFTVASFFVLGFRGGAWEPGLFVAIPLMVVFFSYLFSVCVFLGIVTRSTVAALLLTMAFWLVVVGIDVAERSLLWFLKAEQVGMTSSQMWHRPHGRDRSREEPAKRPEAEAATQPPKDAQQEKSSVKVARALGKSLLKGGIEALASKSEEKGGTADASGEEEETDEEDESFSLETAHKIVYGFKTVLPKTSETIRLLERTLIDLAELPEFPKPRSERRRLRRQTDEKVRETIRARSVAWVIGTSLAFEFVVLACAAWVFCRRDY